MTKPAPRGQQQLLMSPGAGGLLGTFGGKWHILR